jgi:hypothetical protein
MSEWWTYRPADFVMFSPGTYWRLVELYNQDLWPAHLVALAAGLALLWISVRPRPYAHRVTATALAVVWLWVGWAFHWQRYAAINWAATWLAVAFWLQAALLVVLGVLHRGEKRRQTHGWVRGAGWTLAVAGTMLYPLAGLLAGRPWTQAEVFGLMPEPTALASAGLVLASRLPRAGWLCIVPVLSFTLGMATVSMLAR